MALRATNETGSTGDLLSPVFFSHPNRVFNGMLHGCA